MYTCWALVSSKVASPSFCPEAASSFATAPLPDTSGDVPSALVVVIHPSGSVDSGNLICPRIDPSLCCSVWTTRTIEPFGRFMTRSDFGSQSERTFSTDVFCMGSGGGGPLGSSGAGGGAGADAGSALAPFLPFPAGGFFSSFTKLPCSATAPLRFAAACFCLPGPAPALFPASVATGSTDASSALTVMPPASAPAGSVAPAMDAPTLVFSSA